MWSCSRLLHARRWVCDAPLAGARAAPGAPGRATGTGALVRGSTVRDALAGWGAVERGHTSAQRWWAQPSSQLATSGGAA